MDSNDLKGMTLVPTATGAAGAGGSGSGRVAEEGLESPRSKARREMYGLSPSGADIKGKQVAKEPSAVTVQEDEDDDFDLDSDSESQQGKSAVQHTASQNQVDFSLCTFLSVTGSEAKSTAHKY